MDFCWSSRPEHNQGPPTDTAKRRFALIPTRRKIAVWPLGAQSIPPLARGRSSAMGGSTGGGALPDGRGRASAHTRQPRRPQGPRTADAAESHRHKNE